MKQAEQQGGAPGLGRKRVVRRRRGETEGEPRVAGAGDAPLCSLRCQQLRLASRPLSAMVMMMQWGAGTRPAYV